MPVTVGIANALTQNPAVQALLAKGTGYSGYAVYFSLAAKAAQTNYLVLHGLDLPPAAHSMAGPSGLIDGEFQFDSYGNDQPTARQLSQAVKNVLANLSGTLSDGTAIEFYEVSFDGDDPYEIGGGGYIYRAVLRLRAFYTEPVTPSPYTPQLYQGNGAPTLDANPGNNDDLYLDISTGNLYEMVAGAWIFIGVVPQGETELPSLNYHTVSAAGTNAAIVKAAPGVVTGWKIYNNSGYPIYVKLFNKASAPVPGTDEPQQTIGVDAGLSDVSSPGPGVTYSAGIGIAIVKGIADSDSTAVAANDCVVDIFYQ